jgi:hypothetical protein
MFCFVYVDCWRRPNLKRSVPGTAEFVQDLDKATLRRLALQKRGPCEKIVTDRRQGELTFDP